MDGDPFTDAQAAARSFLTHLDFNRDRAAVVSFAKHAHLDQGLTNVQSELDTAINNLATEGGTDIAAGIQFAQEELDGPRHNPEAMPVIIILSDGRSNPEAAMAAAQRAHSDGIWIITIGLGDDANQDLLRALTTRPDQDFYYADSSAELATIYDQIGQEINCEQALLRY